MTFAAGLAEPAYPTQTAAWADYDNDGDLDLYIGNEQYPSQLFENDGHGRFTDVARKAGVENLRLAKGVVWGDFDQDRFPDLYVSNLPGQNRLYRNNGEGSFTDIAAQLGVDEPRYSFTTWFWDYDNDGRQDLYVGSYVPGIHLVCADYLGLEAPREADRLYRARDDGGFEDVAAGVGLIRETQPMGANFGDLDNDGYLDFYLGTGYVDYEGLMPNLLLRNRGGGAFEDVTFSARMGHLQKGHGIAWGDLDNDGDQDIFAQMGGWFAGDAFANALFENPGAPGHWIGVRLVGRDSNRSAIGARIKVTVMGDDEPRAIYRWVNSGGSFGGNPLRQHIGLGSAARVDELEIYWPTSGSTQTLRDVEADRWIEIEEGRPGVRELQLERLRFPEAPRGLAAAPG